MNKLIAVLIAGAFATGVVVAQTPATAPMEKGKIPIAPGAQNSPAGNMDAKEAAKNVEASKMQAPVAKPSAKDPAVQQNLLNSPAQNSPTDSQAMAAKNVKDSKMQPREKMPNIKNLTKEQRAELMRQLQAESKP